MKSYSNLDMMGNLIKNSPSVVNKIAYTDYQALTQDVKEANVFIITDFPVPNSTKTVQVMSAYRQIMNEQTISLFIDDDGDMAQE